MSEGRVAFQENEVKEAWEDILQDKYNCGPTIDDIIDPILKNVEDKDIDEVAKRNGILAGANHEC